MQKENKTQTNDGTHKRNRITIDTRQISAYIEKKYVILFLYPLRTLNRNSPRLNNIIWTSVLNLYLRFKIWYVIHEVSELHKNQAEMILS